jgi:hypothetical protein
MAASSAVTRRRACRRETVESSTRSEAFASRPRIDFPGASGISDRDPSRPHQYGPPGHPRRRREFQRERRRDVGGVFFLDRRRLHRRLVPGASGRVRQHLLRGRTSAFGDASGSQRRRGTHRSRALPRRRRFWNSRDRPSGQPGCDGQGLQRRVSPLAVRPRWSRREAEDQQLGRAEGPNVSRANGTGKRVPMRIAGRFLALLPLPLALLPGITS